jgi:hypothetical protein
MQLYHVFLYFCVIICKKVKKVRIKTLESLLRTLKDSFPNKLPIKEIDKYQLGVLVGQQNIVRFIENYLEKERKDES